MEPARRNAATSASSSAVNLAPALLQRGWRVRVSRAAHPPVHAAEPLIGRLRPRAR